MDNKKKSHLTIFFLAVFGIVALMSLGSVILDHAYWQFIIFGFAMVMILILGNTVDEQ